jgi:hypothetical protein
MLGMLPRVVYKLEPLDRAIDPAKVKNSCKRPALTAKTATSSNVIKVNQSAPPAINVPPHKINHDSKKAMTETADLDIPDNLYRAYSLRL